MKTALIALGVVLLVFLIFGIIRRERVQTRVENTQDRIETRVDTRVDARQN